MMMNSNDDSVDDDQKAFIFISFHFIVKEKAKDYSVNAHPILAQKPPFHKCEKSNILLVLTFREQSACDRVRPCL